MVPLMTFCRLYKWLLRKSYREMSGLPLNAKKCEVFLVNVIGEEKVDMYAEISAD